MIFKNNGNKKDNKSFDFIKENNDDILNNTIEYFFAYGFKLNHCRKLLPNFDINYISEIPIALIDKNFFHYNFSLLFKLMELSEEQRNNILVLTIKEVYKIHIERVILR